MTVRTQAADRPRVRPTVRGVVLAVLVTVLGVVSLGPVREYLGERARIATLERQAQMLERANAGLEAEIKRLHDPAELERLARECLGMVRPGEIAFVTVPKGGQPQPSSC